MNISASKFSSSGCESGWTLYLDQSHISETNQLKQQRDHRNEEEDLSMVSDASSGPPHYHEDDQDYFYQNGSSFSSSNWSHKSANKARQSKKKMKEKCGLQQHRSSLDDTASSPVSKKKSSFSRSEAYTDNILGYSQGFSATRFNGESALGKHFGLFQPSLAKDSTSEEPGDFQGRNWK